MEHEYIIAHADKSVLKISGLEVKGLNTKQLEQILGEKLHTFVRVIGVTGDNIEMDVYDIEPEQVRKNEKGLIESIVLTEGITVTELARHNGKTKGAISQILKKIEKKGLVCREASNGDNKLPLFLTEKGKELDLAHRNYDMVHAGESMNEVRRLYTPEEMNTAFQVLETWLDVRRQVEEERKKNKIKQNYPVNGKD